MWCLGCGADWVRQSGARHHRQADWNVDCRCTEHSCCGRPWFVHRVSALTYVCVPRRTCSFSKLAATAAMPAVELLATMIARCIARAASSFSCTDNNESALSTRRHETECLAVLPPRIQPPWTNLPTQVSEYPASILAWSSLSALEHAASPGRSQTHSEKHSSSIRAQLFLPGRLRGPWRAPPPPPTPPPRPARPPSTAAPQASRWPAAQRYPGPPAAAPPPPPRRPCRSTA